MIMALTKRARKARPVRRVTRGQLLTFAFWVAFLGMGMGKITPVCAQQIIIGPSSEPTSWVTLDRFYELQEEAERAAVAEKEQQSTADVQTKNQESAFAQPERPLALPDMPQIATRHQVPVDATEEDELFAWMRQKKWMTPSEAEEEMARIAEAKRMHHEFGQSPFHLRFAALPGTSLQSIPAGRVTRPIMERDEQARAAAAAAAQAMKTKVAESSAPPVPKTKAEACDILNTYKRKQLEALESDRQTLAALQAALKDMGLSNDLGFVSRADDKVASSEEVGPPPSAVSAVP